MMVYVFKIKYWKYNVNDSKFKKNVCLFKYECLIFLNFWNFWIFLGMKWFLGLICIGSLMIKDGKKKIFVYVFNFYMFCFFKKFIKINFVFSCFNWI